MTVDKFLDSFGSLSNTKNGIVNLRKLILNLAIQGALVEQNIKDTSVNQLLVNIQDKIKSYAKEHKIKLKTKFHKQSITGEIPSNWKLETLENISLIVMGQSPPGTTYNTVGQGVPLINGPVEFGPEALSETVINQYTTEPKKMCEQGDLLLCVRGSTTGRTNIAGFEACIGRGVAAIKGFTLQNWINLFVISQRQTILEMGTGSTFPSVSSGKIAGIHIPIPPLEEQERIVAKVDELMRLVGELEQKQQSKHTARANLCKSNFTALTNSENATEFSKNWQRTTENFDGFIKTQEDIKTLRQSILQLAIQGKLLKQDLNEGCAESLLEQVQLSKEVLAKEGKIKLKKKKTLNLDVVMPFELPNSWQWVELDDIATEVHYGYTASSNPAITKVRLLRITDIQNNKVNWETVPGCEIEEDKVAKYKLEDNDILIARTGGTIGKTFLVEDVSVTAVFASYLIRVIPTQPMFSKYLKIFLESETYWKQLYAKSMGTGQPNVNATSLKSLLLPLPPLEEQKRIVKKVDALMTYCDTLEKLLSEQQETAENLSSAMVAALAA